MAPLVIIAPLASIAAIAPSRRATVHILLLRLRLAVVHPLGLSVTRSDGHGPAVVIVVVVVVGLRAGGAGVLRGGAWVVGRVGEAAVGVVGGGGRGGDRAWGREGAGVVVGLGWVGGGVGVLRRVSEWVCERGGDCARRSGLNEGGRDEYCPRRKDDKAQRRRRTYGLDILGDPFPDGGGARSEGRLEGSVMALGRCSLRERSTRMD